MIETRIIRLKLNPFSLITESGTLPSSTLVTQAVPQNDGGFHFHTRRGVIRAVDPWSVRIIRGKLDTEKFGTLYFLEDGVAQADLYAESEVFRDLLQTLSVGNKSEYINIWVEGLFYANEGLSWDVSVNQLQVAGFSVNTKLGAG